MSAHSNWLEQIKAYQENLRATGINLELPPPSLNELKLEYLEIIPGQSILAKVPFQKRFTNPMGIYQGGLMAACLDEVFGPLSYMTAQRPCVSLSLNLTYLKAFSEKMSECLIKAIVLKKTNSFIFMRGEVTTLEGELMIHAETHVSIFKDQINSKESIR